MHRRSSHLLFAFAPLALLAGSVVLPACGDDEPSPSSTSKAGSQSSMGEAGAETGGADRGGTSGTSGTAGTSNTSEGGASGAAPNGEGGASPLPSNGGAPPDPEPGAGGAANDQSALCEKFCDDEATICTGDLTQYADRASCLTDCSGYDRGAEGDTTGNNLECRIYHLAVAGGSDADAAVVHCPHTGAYPTSYCND